MNGNTNMWHETLNFWSETNNNLHTIVLCHLFRISGNAASDKNIKDGVCAQIEKNFAKAKWKVSLFTHHFQTRACFLAMSFRERHFRCFWSSLKMSHQRIVSVTESRSSDHAHEETTGTWAGRCWGPCRGPRSCRRPQCRHHKGCCAQWKSCKLTDCHRLRPACARHSQAGGSATAPLQRRCSADVASEEGRVGARLEDPRKQQAHVQ